jgi:hypothetical protein
VPQAHGKKFKVFQGQPPSLSSTIPYNGWIESIKKGVKTKDEPAKGEKS